MAALWSLMAALAVLGVLDVHGADADGGKKPKLKKSKEAAASPPAAPAAAESSKNGLKAFADMIPLGKRSSGLRIPTYEDGKPGSLIVADSLIRVDDNRLFLEKLSIKLFGDVSAQDVKVDLKTGTYNMDHQILSSTERSRVSRSDFEIEGDGMVFDTKTSQGKMVGNVQMVIFDLKKTMSSDPKTGTSPAVKPAVSEVPAPTAPAPDAPTSTK